MTEATTAPSETVEPAPASDPLLRVTDLTVDYRTGHRDWTPAVRGATLHVEPGKFVSLVGESGSGKTTLVQGALGLLPPAARIRGGRIRYSNVDVTGWNDHRMARVRGNYVGFIPQDPNTSLNPTKKIGRQVIEAVRFNRSERLTAAGFRAAALESLRAAGLTDAERVFVQYPHELSGGMKQRALIAVALAGRPKLIVADEPTSALDVTVQKRILDHLHGLRAELGIGLLLVTHDLGVALDRSDRILVMQQGEIVEAGPVRQVLAEARSDYTRRLLDAAPARHAGRLLPTRPVDNAAKLSDPAGLLAPPSAGVGEAAAARDGKISVALRADGLSKTYRLRGRGGRRELRALDNTGLTVRRGTTHAIVGESGAGKSTLAGILSGFLPADRGTVRLGDRDLATIDRRELRRELQFVFQNPYTSLDPRFTVERIVAEPLRAFKLAPGRQATRERVTELLRAVALDDSYRHRRPSQLSGGQRQRVAIARALAPDPQVLVLDEAVSALDVSVQAQILQLLVDLQAQFGLSYVFVTHDLGVVRLIADDVTVMKDGAVVESGPAERVLRAPEHEYTRQLLDAIPGGALASAAE